MKFNQGTYLAREAFSTLGRHKGVTLLSVMIMGLSLLVLAAFLLATDNVFTFFDRTKQEMKVFVYLDDGLAPTVVEDYYRLLMSMDEVEAIEYISKDQAMTEFKEELGEDGAVLDVLESNPLPASYRVTLKPQYREKEQIERFAGVVGAMNAVEEVNYGKDFIDQFSSIMQAFLYVDLVLGLIVIVSSIFIVANTVRLTILSRQKSIEVLKLVGATNRFITTPFVIEGAVQGGLAAVFSLALLLVIYLVLKGMLPDLAFLGPNKIGLYAVTCILLGAVGSFASLRRHLKL
ncbi:MAG: permease-like cell division protein FtsX [bacterium]